MRQNPVSLRGRADVASSTFGFQGGGGHGWTDAEGWTLKQSRRNVRRAKVSRRKGRRANGGGGFHPWVACQRCYNSWVYVDSGKSSCKRCGTDFPMCWPRLAGNSGDGDALDADMHGPGDPRAQLPHHEHYIQMLGDMGIQLDDERAGLLASGVLAKHCGTSAAAPANDAAAAAVPQPPKGGAKWVAASNKVSAALREQKAARKAWQKVQEAVEYHAGKLRELDQTFPAARERFKNACAEVERSQAAAGVADLGAASDEEGELERYKRKIAEMQRKIEELEAASFRGNGGAGQVASGGVEAAGAGGRVAAGVIAQAFRAAQARAERILPGPLQLQGAGDGPKPAKLLRRSRYDSRSPSEGEGEGW